MELGLSFLPTASCCEWEKKKKINEEHAPNNMITTSMNRLRNLAHESYTSTSVNQIYLPPHLTTTSNPEHS
jgi:hypothetical protein